MNLSLIRSMTRSAVFELENDLCYRPAHPFIVTLNGRTVYEACNTNVFSLFSLLPGTEYTVGVQAEGESLTCTFTTEAETFFVDASRYGLVADGTTDNTLKLQAALSTCPKGGTVYVPAGRYRTCSLFMKSCTTLYLEKGAVLLGDNDRTHYPILPGVIPSEKWHPTIWGTALPVCRKLQPPGPSSTALPGFTSTLWPPDSSVTLPSDTSSR